LQIVKKSRTTGDAPSVSRWGGREASVLLAPQ